MRMGQWLWNHRERRKDRHRKNRKAARPLWAHFGSCLAICNPIWIRVPRVHIKLPHSLWSSCYIHWLVWRWGRPDFRTWTRCFFSWFRIRCLVSGGWDVGFFPWLIRTSGWCFGTWILWLSIQLGISSFELANIFQRGRSQPPTSYHFPQKILFANGQIGDGDQSIFIGIYIHKKSKF